MRVIFSSDEEEDIQPILRVRTPKTPNESIISSENEKITINEENEENVSTSLKVY